MRKRWVGALLWGAVALVVIGAGTAAVSYASGSSGRDVLSQQDVDRELAGLPSGDVGSAPPSQAPVASWQAVTTSVGTFVVSCDGSMTTLMRFTQASGYRADHAEYGPDRSLTVEFESDVKDDATITLACVDGKAKANVVFEADDHGGDRGATPPTPGDDHGGGGSGRGGQDDPPGDDHS